MYENIKWRHQEAIQGKMKHADGTYKFTLKSYIKLKLLILDDWGLQEFNGKSLAILNEIISDRFENGSIIIANNRPFKSWSELFKERVIASALLV